MPKQARLSADQVVILGTAAHKLAVDHRADIEPRVEAGAIDHLIEDVNSLRGDSRGTVVANVQKKEATSNKGDAVELGFSIAHTFREALKKKHRKDKSLLKAFGVGNRMVKEKASTVSDSLKLILEGIQKHNAEAKAAGILPADIAQATQALADLDTTGGAQTEKKVTAKQATAARARTQQRIEDTVDGIIGAALFAFRTQPDVLKQFTDLTPQVAAKPAVKPAAPKT